MPFNKVQRCIYKSTSLVDVVCQLRFPPILRIDNEMPAKFQDKIRDVFPSFRQDKSIQQNIVKIDGFQNPLTTMDEAKLQIFEMDNKNYFVVLARTFISVKSQNRSYTRWEDFKKIAFDVIVKFMDIYAPAYYTRVGLEYINVFPDEMLKQDGAKRSEYISPTFLSSYEEMLKPEELLSFMNICEVSIGNECKSRISTQTVASQNDPSKTGISLDYDLYKDSKTSIDNFSSVLEYLHDNSTKILRTVITQKLHEKMEPTTI